jgi:hypothetical protein
VIVERRVNALSGTAFAAVELVDVFELVLLFVESALAGGVSVAEDGV